MDKISKHISYREATHSQTAQRLGIENKPTEDDIKRMKLVAVKCWEPIREHYGKPIVISSFFRSWKLNGNVPGSSKTSQHPIGEAIDFICEDMAELFAWIQKNIEFDQLIWEYGTDDEPAWIHISYTEQRPNRQEVLKVKRVGEKIIWSRL